MVIGLDLNEIISSIRVSGQSLWTVTSYGVLITATLIIIRIICTYGALATTMIMRHFIPVADSRYHGLQDPLLLGWSGMCGVVSLAAALSIPLTATWDGIPSTQCYSLYHIHRYLVDPSSSGLDFTRTDQAHSFSWFRRLHEWQQGEKTDTMRACQDKSATSARVGTMW